MRFATEADGMKRTPHCQAELWLKNDEMQF